MIEERARVISVEQDIAWVETQRHTACGKCSAQKGCGTTALTKLTSHKPWRLRVLNTLNARHGEEVVIALDEYALLRGSILLYAMPLGALLLGAAVGQALTLTAPDLGAVLGAVGGLGGGLMVAQRLSSRLLRSGRYEPLMIRRAPSDPSSLL